MINKFTNLFTNNRIFEDTYMRRLCAVACTFTLVVLCFSCQTEATVAIDNSLIPGQQILIPEVVSQNSIEKPSEDIPKIVIVDIEVPQEKQDEVIEETDEVVEEEQEQKKENIIYYAIEDNDTFYLDEVYQDFLWEELKKYNHSELYSLCIGLMLHESHFDINCISDTNDHGLMQINIGNEKWLKRELDIVSLDDPYDNIRCGVYMICLYYNEYNDVEQALICYNQGYVGSTKSTKYSRCVINDVFKLYPVD